MQGGTIVVKALPEETFAPVKRISIWHSPDAPNFVVFGEEVNDIPVASLPARPGLLLFVAYLAWLAHMDRRHWTDGVSGGARVAYPWQCADAQPRRVEAGDVAATSKKFRRASL